jgi:hypothetical protein
MYISTINKKKIKNVLVQTKFYWSWVGGPVVIVRTGNDPLTKKQMIVYIFTN